MSSACSSDPGYYTRIDLVNYDLDTNYGRLLAGYTDISNTCGGNFDISDISYGNMALNLYNSGETAEIVSDSPFNKASLRIHYRSTGSLPDVANNKHYWTLSSKDEKIKMNVKTKEVFLSAVDADCEYSLHADLTNIPASRMYRHTGSGVDE